MPFFRDLAAALAVLVFAIGGPSWLLVIFG